MSTEADRKNGLPGSRKWRPWSHPPLFKGLVYDGTFNVFDGHRILNNSQNTRSFAWGWADPASKLWEVVCFKKPLQGFTPPILINQLIEFRNFVAKRASRVLLKLLKKNDQGQIKKSL